MTNENKRPEIYTYLEGQFGAVREVQIIQGTEIAKIKMALKALTEKERPSGGCRDYIDKGDEENEKAINNLALKVNQKVSYGKLYTILGAVGTLIATVTTIIISLT